MIPSMKNVFLCYTISMFAEQNNNINTNQEADEAVQGTPTAKAEHAKIEQAPIDQAHSARRVLEIIGDYIQSHDPKDLLQHLLAVGAHLGHPTRAWNPMMSKFIAGVTNNKCHVVDLKHTISHLIKALTVLYNAAKTNQKILFVCTADQMHDIVSVEAQRCLQYYVTNRWLGGTLTNWDTVKKSIRTLKSLESVLSDENAVSLLKKKELITMQRRVKKLRSTLGGIESMHDRPSIVIISSIVKEHTVVKEVRSLQKLGFKIKSIALADTNSNPYTVDYPIPANDDSIRVIEFMFKLFANIILEGLVDGNNDVERNLAVVSSVDTTENIDASAA